jgi:integrase
MASINLTASAIEKLNYDSKGASRQVLWDSKVAGLGVRVTPAGGKQYVLSYRRHGRSRLMSLGIVADFRNVTDARDTAQEYLRKMRRDDVDPLVERSRQKAAGSITQMLDRWLTQHVAKKRKASTHADYKIHVDKHLKPLFGAHRPADLTRPEVRRLHARISTKAPYTANRVVASLRAAFSWASKQDDGTLPANHQNPAQGIEFNPEKARDELLRPDELPAITTAIEQEPDPWVRGYLWLLLLTGARKTELLKLRWSDVRIDQGEIVLRDTKNHSDFALKVAGAAVDVLRNIPRLSGTDFVFPNRRSDGTRGHMVGPRAPWAAALKRAGIERRVTLHDVRRSAGTLLARAGFTAEQIARQLNHKSAITSKHYIRIASDLQQQMADELARAGVAKPGKVAGIGTRRRVSIANERS